MKTRRYPRVPLVVVLAALVILLTSALQIAVTEIVTLEARMDRVHLQGMAVGQQMCLGIQPELDRLPARRISGGLL
ncbi:hypothetical protein AVHY2522_23635 [Acidovorax sp. SUPP2522]|uniref:hypothetical protein n=1 Tax=unclassified Acidovorax TaxID=2684926 RepID=UPI0023490664|nr:MULTISPECIES: hypothetical protein [unclassified Acidovorax]WCM99946.1 hypothetical protein M5C96_11410 [Acidovorax sp. GBBC 1281]GKT19753.1 hypothetical protein AVHY2522_23635 [Acidovorax sp. SUPP2522]